MSQREPRAKCHRAEGSYRTLIHLLNRRYQEEYGRAERLQADLDGLLGSRARKLLSLWTHVKGWFRGLPAAAPARPAQATQTLCLAAGQPTGRVSIIIPFKDRTELLHGCLKSLR